jgi:hypothetical protein
VRACAFSSSMAHTVLVDDAHTVVCGRTGLYANRRPSQAADEPATPLAATGAVNGAPDLERSSVPVDAAAVAVAAAGKTPAVVAASQQHPKQTDGAKPNSASISKKRRREEREPIEVIDRPPPPKVEPLASRPSPTAGRGKAVDRRPPPGMHQRHLWRHARSLTRRG